MTQHPASDLVQCQTTRASLAPFARVQVHPPADCATCVVDLMFVAMQVELGHDSVQVAAAPSSAAFWWEDPPSNTIVRTRADLNTSGLRVRGAPGEAVFVRLLSDEIVEMHGFEAVATVMDARDAPGPGGASTSNCYDSQGEEACAGRGACVPGGGDTENELGECVCKEGYFGPTCREEVCDDVNAAPTRPLWNLVREPLDLGGGNFGRRLLMFLCFVLYSANPTGRWVTVSRCCSVSSFSWPPRRTSLGALTDVCNAGSVRQGDARFPVKGILRMSRILSLPTLSLRISVCF